MSISAEVGSGSLQQPGQPHLSFVIGQDHHGHWLAVEVHGLAGGIFRSRTDAVHYAEFETDRQPGAFRMASEPIELRL